MPGKFTGLQLLAYMHVGLRQMDPTLDTEIDLEKEYCRALELFQDAEPE